MAVTMRLKGCAGERLPPKSRANAHKPMKTPTTNKGISVYPHWRDLCRMVSFNNSMMDADAVERVLISFSPLPNSHS